METNYKAGSIIFFEGDYASEMFIVKSGKVELIRELGDGEIVLLTIGESEFFGEMALFGQEKRTATARAAEDTELVTINKPTLEAQFEKVPEWLVVMMKTIAQRILTTGKGIKIKFPVSVEYSIFKTLLLMLEEYGMNEEKGRSINLTLVREEISNILGLSTDQIDDWLKQFNFVNLIKVLSTKNKIIIFDEERLNKYLTYLIMQSPLRDTVSEPLDRETTLSFERLYKLLDRT